MYQSITFSPLKRDKVEINAAKIAEDGRISVSLEMFVSDTDEGSSTLSYLQVVLPAETWSQIAERVKKIENEIQAGV